VKWHDDESKKIFKEAFAELGEEGLAELESSLIPHWLPDNELIEFLITRYMMEEPDLTEEEILKKAEEIVKELREFEKMDDDDERVLKTKKEYFDWAWSDEDKLREALIEDYTRYYKNKDKEIILKEVEKEIEILKVGAINRLARQKKLGLMS